MQPMKLCLLFSLTAAFGLLSAQAQDRPNVVIIYGDDVGWGDLGSYGARKIPTPHLDKLASQGLRFTDGHCSAATCTPSRFSMLTGIHGFRQGVRILRPDAPMTIKPGSLTLPALFKKAGYHTAVVGKWHLGIGDGKNKVDWNGNVKPGPLEVGFDYSFLLPSTNDRVPCVYVENHRVVNLDPKDPLYVGEKPADFKGTVYPDGRKTPEAMTYYMNSHGHNMSVINGIGRIGQMWGGKSALWNDESMADEFTKQSNKYIASRKGKKEPFFLFWSAADIHVPRTPHPRFKDKSQLSYRGDAMVQLDWCVGQVMEALEKNGMVENTILIFSSDNGPVYDDGYDDGTTVKTSKAEVDRGHDGSGPYRGGKYQIYEGGHRVPLILRWPAKVKPAVSGATINQIDFIASFASMLGIELAEHEAIDSRNYIDALLGKDAKGSDILVSEARGLAIRQGNWKFIAGGTQKGGKNAPKGPVKGQLYNLKDDVGEQNNVIAENQEKAQELQTLLNEKVKQGPGVRAALKGK